MAHFDGNKRKVKALDQWRTVSETGTNRAVIGPSLTLYEHLRAEAGTELHQMAQSLIIGKSTDTET